MRRTSSTAVLGLLLTLAFGTPAPANAAADARPAATLTSATAEANRLIAASGSPDLFENITTNGVARVRHTASGLVCSFKPGAANNTLVLYSHPGWALGDDVGCNADMGEVYLTYYATRYPPGYSAEDSARDAAAAIRNRFPEARPHSGTAASVEAPEGVGPIARTAFVIGGDAQPGYTHALNAKVGEWIFKQRMTVRGGDIEILAAQVIAASGFNAVLQAAAEPR